jgi:hypothetical protein
VKGGKEKRASQRGGLRLVGDCESDGAQQSRLLGRPAYQVPEQVQPSSYGFIADWFWQGASSVAAAVHRREISGIEETCIVVQCVATADMKSESRTLSRQARCAQHGVGALR